MLNHLKVESWSEQQDNVDSSLKIMRSKFGCRNVSEKEKITSLDSEIVGKTSEEQQKDGLLVNMCLAEICKEAVGENQ